MYDVHGDIEVEELMTSGFVVWLGVHLRRGSVIVSKVKKDKRTRYSANKHKRSTFVGCGSCSGKKLNPYYILQGVKRLNDIYLEKDGRLKGTSEGSAYSISESGYMNDKIWEDEYVPFLVKETRSLIQETKRETKWQPLLLDGFLSHTMTFKVYFH